MSDLRDSLDHTLRAIDPGPAPVDQTMRVGKRIRVRRRAAMVASVGAVAACAAVGYPVLSHLAASAPAPVTSQSRVLLTGTEGGIPWKVTVSVGPRQTCFRYVTSGETASVCGASRLMTTTRYQGSSGDPHNPPATVYGSAAPSVSYLVVTLANGHTVRVSPVQIGGERLFAFALHKGQAARLWTAYDAAGKPLSSGRF